MQPIGMRDRIPADYPVVAFLTLALAYTALSCLGLQWSTISGAASPVWPASGVALAGLLLGGLRLWPAILLGRLAAGWLSGSQQPVWAELAIAAANTLAVVLPLTAARRRGGIDPALPDLPQLLRYFGWGGLIGAMIAATLGTITIAISSGIPPESLFKTYSHWLVAYFVGAILIGPLVLSWLSPAPPLTPLRRLHFTVVMLVTTAFAGLFLLPPDQAFLRTWHVFPVLVWAALAFELRGASLGVTIIAAMAIWATERGLGPMTRISFSSGLQVSLVQQFIAVTTLTILVLAVVANERRAKNALAAQGHMLRQAEEEARARAEELEVLLAAVPAAIWVARDPACAEITGNQFAAELLHLPDPDENVSKSSEQNPAVSHFIVLDSAGQELAPDDLPVQRAARGEVIRNFEERVVFADGQVRDILGNATPLRGPGGQLRGAVAAFIDITERKAAQSREQLLSREVDHRAKNIMAVIQAIVQLTEAEDIAAFRKAISGRINSLARTHTLLAQNRWDGAELRELIEEELAPYLPRQGVQAGRVTLTGPQVRLRPSTAQSIALIVHELITNALKYGALSDPHGIVTIDWQVDTPGPDQRVTLCWRERGGPSILPPATPGFGLSLIEATARDQLYGTISQTWDTAGLTVEFTVPVGDLFRQT